MQSNLVYNPQDLSRTFADDDARGHGVASCHARHDRAIGNAKVVNSINLEIVVDNRHRIATHLGGAGLVMIGNGSIADEVLERGPFQLARHHLALGKWPQCGGVAYFAAEFYTDDCGSEIVGMRKEIRFNLYRIQGIGPGQTDTASALRPYDPSQQGPAAVRQAESSGILGARQWKFDLARL
jgi:hypothetical protein